MEKTKHLPQSTLLKISIISFILFVGLGMWANNTILGASYPSQNLQLNHVQSFDYKIAESINAKRTPALTYFLSVMTHLGDTKAGSQISIGILIILAIFAHRKYLIVFVLNLGLLAGSTVLFKNIFARPRPGMLENDTLPRMLIDVGGMSYPSGHAAFAAILFIFFAWLMIHTLKHRTGRVIAISLAGFVAAMICYSRVYLGVHFASDVVGGILLAITLSSFSLFIIRKFVAKQS
jgi:undecaprenyl-diphosphatase